MEVPELSMAPRADLDALRNAFRTSRRVLINDFLLDACARYLHKEMTAVDAWGLVLCVDGNVLSVAPEVRRGCTESDELECIDAAYGTGRTQFSFLYDGLGYVPESSTNSDEAPGWLIAYSAFVNSPEFLQFLNNVTDRGVCTGSLQATRHRPGHFRMFNDDGDAATRRRIVASLNLTPAWRPIWGGLLQFRSFLGHIEAAHSPRFNTLSIFDIRESHSISAVAPYAQSRRLALTAWLQGE